MWQNSAFSWVLRSSLNAIDAEENFFALALEQAHFAQGSTHPNPSVGAVVVKDGRILSVGYTHPVGGMHAEKHALYNCSVNPKGATIFVTLEPCCHTGRTPPCTEAIINAGLARVVYGVEDPNPRVAGQGLAQLKAAGIEVAVIGHPLLRALAEQSIRPFRSLIKRKHPYVVLKVASSADYAIGFKDRRVKITGESSDVIVHQLRRAHDAILIGANTLRIDNPELIARLGKEQHQKQPIRIVLGSDLNLDPQAKFFNATAASWVICPNTVQAAEKRRLEQQQIAVISLEDFSLKNILAELGARGISSLMVEPGQQLLKSFMDAQLFDELWWFRSKNSLGAPGLSIAHLLEGTQLFEHNLLSLPEDELGILSGSHHF